MMRMEAEGIVPEKGWETVKGGIAKIAATLGSLEKNNQRVKSE